IKTNPKSARRKLMEALAPSPPIPVRQAVAGESQPTPATEPAEPTSDQTAVVADLHWLIHQGHVIEFANGTLETAKKPLPKPPKPQAKPAEQLAETAAPTEVSGAETTVPESQVGPVPAENPEPAT